MSRKQRVATPRPATTSPVSLTPKEQAKLDQMFGEMIARQTAVQQLEGQIAALKAEQEHLRGKVLGRVELLLEARGLPAENATVNWNGEHVVVIPPTMVPIVSRNGASKT